MIPATSLPFAPSPIPGERVFAMTSARGKQTALSRRCYWKEGTKGGRMIGCRHITLFVLQIYCSMKKAVIISVCCYRSKAGLKNREWEHIHTHTHTNTHTDMHINKLLSLHQYIVTPVASQHEYWNF